ncbi:MAG: GlsB/YeaQ/YmgE family stress response membrane protein [Armatimonadota bacterium]
MSSVTAWLLTLIAGIVVGVVVALALGRGSRAPFWAFIAAGLVGSAVGRLALVFSFLPWHPSFLGGAVGAIILSLVCWVAARSPKPA